jgi:serine/threonine protein kinase
MGGGVIGQIVDGHEVIRPLGAGGMGEVYLARGDGGSLRALKVVRTDRGADPQSAARFRREVIALRKLRHPAIVQMLDAGRLETGELYLAMEYVAGQDLQHMVGDGGPLALHETLALLARVAAALAYAHAQGIVHRDLKPGNVLIEDGDTERTKIIDFGLAKIYAEEKLTRLTEDQQVLGSPLYWAPEQCTSSEVGPAADVYGLGGIAYFALSGKPMFSPRPAVGLVYAHAHEMPEPLSARCPDIEPRFDEVIRACIAKSPAARPTAAQLADELAVMAERAPKVPRPRATPLPPGLFSADDAATNQIRQIALDLAAVLELPTDELDRTQNKLSELELDLAMLDSEVDMAIDAELEHRHDGVASEVEGLRQRLDDCFRALIDTALAARTHAPADAAPLYEELEELFTRVRAR